MTKKDVFNVTKASGAKVPFQVEKLKKSLLRAGATHEQSEDIADEVTNNLSEGLATKTIYKTAFNLLKNYSRPVAARYKLKTAMLELGPSGFPFEQFVAELLKFKGYQTKVGTFERGRCVNHEVDVIAETEKELLLVECKFHNRPGVISDVKTPLYIQSRYLDVLENWKKNPSISTKFHQGWVVTNTRFSIDAMQYGKCVGLHLVGWDYPKNDGLRDWIDASGLHPITCLTSLSQAEKERLLERKIVLCKTICESDNILQTIGIKAPRLYKVIEECTALSENK